MTVPKQRHTKSRRNKRRMHLFLKEPVLNLCPKCAKPVLGHTACQNCGYYKGEEIIDVLKKLTKKERKKKEREMKAKEEAEKSYSAKASAPALRPSADKSAGKEGGLSWEELSKK